MALTPVSIYESDKTGATETINMQSKTATIANAFYGLDANNAPISVPVLKAGKSVTFTVLKDVVALQLDLTSTDPKSEEVIFYQGADPIAGAFADDTVANHSGIATLLIKGT